MAPEVLVDFPVQLSVVDRELLSKAKGGFFSVSEVLVFKVLGGSDSFFCQAVLSCQDRPGLLSVLTAKEASDVDPKELLEGVIDNPSPEGRPPEPRPRLEPARL